MLKWLGIGFSVLTWTGATCAGTIGINFGSTTAAANWNNVNTVTADIANLTYLEGGSSGYTLITDNANTFNGMNPNGTPTPGSPASDYFPSTVTNNAFFGNTAVFDGVSRPQAYLTFGNLNPAATYQFTFFASRIGATDNRETEYKVIGAATDTVYLNVSGNTSSIAQTVFLTPDANNEIHLEVRAGPSNNNGTTRFYYLGGVHISEVIPEPASLGLIAAGALGVLSRRRI